MEENLEIRKLKKNPKWIKWGYIVCIILIIGSIGVMNYRIENETPEPIDFTTDGALGMGTDVYAYLNVEALTEEVAIYGDTENEYDSSNDRYYIAFNNGYAYVVDLNFETIDQLQAIQDYTYSQDENAVQPEPVTIYGMTEEVPSELKEMVVNFYNEAMNLEEGLTAEQFELYFGSVLLNVRRAPVDTLIEEIVLILSGIALITIIVCHIAIKVSTRKSLKYLKKNEYEQDLEQQLELNVEKNDNKNKIILTKDYVVDRKNGFIAFKYSDVKWIHIHNLKQYGITVSSSIIVYLKDAKTRFQILEIKGKPTEEFIEILNTICEKMPVDGLKGYTPENIKAFKEYKKEVKRNGI